MGNMKKILVLAPYSVEILKALGDSKLNLNKNAKIILIGSKKIIYDILVEHKISFIFDIIDVSGEIEICLYAKSIVKKENVDLIIFGMIPEYFYYKVFESKINIDSYVDINLIEINNYLSFALSNNINEINNFDRYNGLKIAKNFMKLLNINRIKATIVYPKIYDYMIEAKINKLISNDVVFDEVTLLSTKTLLDDIENQNYKPNLLIFNSSDSLNNYIDFIQVLEKPKIAKIIIYNDNLIYAVDCLNNCDYNNLRFSFNIINRLINKYSSQIAS